MSFQNRNTAGLYRVVILSTVLNLLFTPAIAADGRTDTVALSGDPTGIAGVNYGLFFSSSIQLNDTGQVARGRPVSPAPSMSVYSI